MGSINNNGRWKHRKHLMGLFWFRMDYGCTPLLAVGNQRQSLIMDISRPLKQSGFDSSFTSGLTVVSLKKKKEEKRDRVSQTIHQEPLQQAALCRFHHWIDVSETDQAGFTSHPLRTFTSNRWARYNFTVESLWPDLIWHKLLLHLWRTYFVNGLPFFEYVFLHIFTALYLLIQSICLKLALDCVCVCMCMC